MDRNTYRSTVDTYGRESLWTVGRVFRWVVLPLLLLSLGLGVLRILTAPGRAAVGVVERTLDPDAVLANYEWFKQTNQDVQAIDVQLKHVEENVKRFKEDAGPRTGWDYPTSIEYSRLNSILLGLQNQRQNLVAQYNARSQMVNRSLFKSKNLPETLQ